MQPGSIAERSVCQFIQIQVKNKRSFVPLTHSTTMTFPMRSPAQMVLVGTLLTTRDVARITARFIMDIHSRADLLSKGIHCLGHMYPLHHHLRRFLPSVLLYGFPVMQHPQRSTMDNSRLSTGDRKTPNHVLHPAIGRVLDQYGRATSAAMKGPCPYIQQKITQSRAPTPEVLQALRLP